MAVEMLDVAKLYVALFGRAPEKEGLAYWYEQANKNGWDLAQLANAMYEAALQYEDYAYLQDPQKLVEAIYENVLGKTYNDDPDGINYWTEQIKSGAISPGEVARVIIETAEKYYPDHPATKTLENRAEVALYVAQKIDKFNGDFTEFKKFVDVVNDDPASIEMAKKMVDSYVEAGVDYLLQPGHDFVTGSSYDDTFYAPLTQTDDGRVTNTLESGDVIDGKGGNDTLIADVSYTVTSNNNTGRPGTEAIAPVVKDVEKIELTAQYCTADARHGSNLDAGDIQGVQEYWDVDSRANLQIEDVRQLPEELTFGMKDTDPGVDYSVFFDPEMVSKDRVVAKQSSLTIILDDKNSDQLEHFSINGIKFVLDGKTYELQTPDGSPLGKTYEEFAENLQKLIDANPELADRLKVTYVGGDAIVIEDTKGGTFEPIGFTWVDNVVPPQGELSWDMKVGAPIEETAPPTTHVILDNVGRTSQGGTLDIGSMGDGGIKVMNIDVDRSSWLTSIVSKSNFADPITGKDQLETVKLHSIGNNGDLTVGTPVPSVDNRVTDGFIDVKEVLNEGFLGNLKYGVTLTDNAVDRYLSKASDVVQFTYEGGDGNDDITIVDRSIDYSLSADPFFSMKVSLGDGDDRLNLDMANVKSVEVDGGLGNNTIAVKNSHGTTTDNTFKAFNNFSTYVIEATDDTAHNFDTMPVQHVVVATGNVDTEIIHLPADADVTISGENQTLVDTNADQYFGQVAIEAAKVTPEDTAVKVTLKNTARYNGTLVVDTLSVGGYGTELSAITTLDLESTGRQKTVNVVNNLTAPTVSNFILEGDKDLYVTLTAAANSAATNAADRESLTVDASKFSKDAKLALNLDASIPSNINENADDTVQLVGGEGDQDTLALYSANSVNITSNTQVSGFENVVFGAQATFDVANKKQLFTPQGINGNVDLSKFMGVSNYAIYNTNGDLTLKALSGTENMAINAHEGFIGGALSFYSATQDSTNTLSLTISDFGVVTPNGISYDMDYTGYSLSINVKDFAAVDLNIPDVPSNTVINMPITLTDVEGNDISTVVLTGGYSVGTPVDATNQIDKVKLTLNNISNEALKTLDVSGFNGYVTGLTIDTTQGDNNVSVTLNKWGGTVKELNNSTETSNVVYYLKNEMLKGGVWTISGFETGDGTHQGNAVDADDKSIIDVSALGIDNMADLKIWSIANTAVYYDSTTSTVNLDGNGTATDTNEFVIAVDLSGDSTVDAQSDIFQLAGIDLNGSTANIPASISEAQLGLDLNHDGKVSATTTFAITTDSSYDFNGDNTNDVAYVIDLSSANLDPTSPADDALYLVTPNDTTAHNFNILVGVNDGSVTLNEDFFNGL